MSNHDIDLEILKLTAHELKSLKDDLVFLGGSTISLFITDPQNVSIRETLDVDCVVEVSHRNAYEDISKQLRSLGFNEDMQSSVACRFKKGSLLLDVMPTDSRILGFTNIWYKDGFKHSVKITVDAVEINVFDLPYLIATKIEAFKGRGNGQFMYSHDIEDIVTLFDGRSTIANDLNKADKAVREYLKTEINKLMGEKNFITSLDAHISDRLNLAGRTQIVIDRINGFLNKNNL